MAVSAYNSEGLLKKNPLLGTSLAADESRKKEKEKFGSLFERAKGFINDKAGFQSLIQQEQAAENAPDLATLAAAEGSLGTSNQQLLGLQNKKAELGKTMSDTSSAIDELQGAYWKNMKAWDQAHPEIAKAAQENWDALGTKSQKKVYYKGKRSGDVHRQYKELKEQFQAELEANPELQAQYEALQGSGGANIPGTGGDRTGSQIGDTNLELFKTFTGAFGPANPFAYGQDPLKMFSSIKNIKKANSNIMDPGQVGFNPLMGEFKFNPLNSAGIKNIAKGFFDPGNLGSLVTSALGIGSKKKERRARRKMRAGGRDLAYLDQLGLTKGRTALDTLANARSIDETKSRISDLQSTVSTTRSTLADRANLYGGFFS